MGYKIGLLLATCAIKRRIMLIIFYYNACSQGKFGSSASPGQESAWQCFLYSTQSWRIDWWATGRKQVVKYKRKGFDTLIAIICWCLWKQRNGKVFGGARILNEWGMTEIIFQELKLWAMAGTIGVQQFIE